MKKKIDAWKIDADINEQLRSKEPVTLQYGSTSAKISLAKFLSAGKACTSVSLFTLPRG